MPQLSLYIDNETMKLLQIKAEDEHVSLSRCATEAIRSALKPCWPRGFFNLYGSVDDEFFTEPEELPFELDNARLAIE